MNVNPMNMVKGVGFTLKLVEVKQLDSVKMLALCLDPEGQYIEVPTIVHRAGVRPEVGQRWLIDRSLGGWTFAALVDDSTPGPFPPGPPGSTTVMRFATATERDVWLPAPAKGMLCWLDDSARYWEYTGTAWVVLVPSMTTDLLWVPLPTSMVNPGHGYTAAYAVWQGQVRLRGRLQLTGGTDIPNGQLLGTVPAALVPPVSAGGDGQCNNLSTRVATVRIEIAVDGTVTLVDSLTVRPTWVGLDGVSWWLA